MRRSPWPALLVLLLASTILAGCGMVAAGAVALARDPERTVKALYNPAGKAVAVIPFTYQGHRPFETEHGLVLAETLEKELRVHVKKVRIVPAAKAKDYLTGIAPAEVDSGLLAEMLGADVVISGEILEVRLSDNLNRMDANVRVEAYDAKAHAIVLREDVAARYPEVHSLTRMDLSRPGSFRGAIESAGRAVGRLFYNHRVPNMPTGSLHE
ncbi:MAG: hypothetical protein V2A58_17275 [Planctomycetota bacterium]